jgi:hypothetical protein
MIEARGAPGSLNGKTADLMRTYSSAVASAGRSGGCPVVPTSATGNPRSATSAAILRMTIFLDCIHPPPLQAQSPRVRGVRRTSPHRGGQCGVVIEPARDRFRACTRLGPKRTTCIICGVAVQSCAARLTAVKTHEYRLLGCEPQCRVLYPVGNGRRRRAGFGEPEQRLVRSLSNCFSEDGQRCFEPSKAFLCHAPPRCPARTNL